jgi:hypothetical protein
LSKDQVVPKTRQDHLSFCAIILYEYPNIPIWKLIEKYAIETGIRRNTCENYFKLAGKKIGRVWR